MRWTALRAARAGLAARGIVERGGRPCLLFHTCFLANRPEHQVGSSYGHPRACQYRLR